ncbi:MAG: hypothetical protein RL033_5108 [Pseudomonadota bacterium]|jgi:diacylglycerol kinase (ATP)
MAAPRALSLAARLRSFVYAGRGVVTLLRSQHNAWIHAVATLATLSLAGWLGVPRSDWLVLILAIVAVWAAEAFNTALEFLADAVSPEFHPLVEKAKDVAAGGVLICSVGAAAVALLVFGPYLLAALG